MPSEPRAGSAAADDFVGQERIEVVHRVDLSRRNVGPTEAERRHAAFHCAEHVVRLYAKAVCAGVTAPNNLNVLALDRLTASRIHERRPRALDPWS